MRLTISILALSFLFNAHAQDRFTPYDAPGMTREEVFVFTQKPAVKFLGNDKYLITFAVKAACDATVELVDATGQTIRHLASGVLGRNAPPPFVKTTLEQKILWDGKDDFGAYVKNPTALRIRVSLGLKPVFEKLLGWNPYDCVGEYRGIVASPEGVYVLASRENKASTAGHPQFRRYDHNGDYQATVMPPKGDLPLEKSSGMESLEIAPGQRVRHSHVGHAGFVGTVSGYGCYLPGGVVSPQQPCLLGDQIVYANSFAWTYAGRNVPVKVYRFNRSDGSAPDGGYAWHQLTRPKVSFAYQRFKLAASPDGHWLYLCGPSKGAHQRGRGYGVYRLNAQDPAAKLTLFQGDDRKPGSDNTHFNRTEGIACDAKGRVYVCDHNNNRIQIYSEKGTFLKTIKIQRPLLIQIHRKNGTLYIYQEGSEKGKSILRILKLESFDNPKEVAHFDLGAGASGPFFIGHDLHLAIDSWHSPTRIWTTRSANRLTILEDRGASLVVHREFQDDVKKAGLLPNMMHCRFAKVTADPTREHLYFSGSTFGSRLIRYDLKDSSYKLMKFPAGSDFGPDLAIDKRGYLLTHNFKSVWRHDPMRVLSDRKNKGKMVEVPFDYGNYGTNFGAIELKDQAGAKTFQDGFGVNLRGDFAVVSNIYYVPKFEDAARPLVAATFGSITGRSYEKTMTKFKEQQKNGEQVYSVKRWPGRVLSGGTIWTFDRHGELQGEDLISGLSLTNGVSIDVSGDLYTVFSSPKMVGGVPFLTDKGKKIGSDKRSSHPFTGTLMKSTARGAKILRTNAPIPLEETPKRAPDLTHNGGFGWETNKASWRKGNAWVEGAEWLYAGASPIVPTGCSCPNMRHYTDWNKITFVPEAYRHSVGVLDASGNLIMHLGRYGNADSGRGKDSTVKVGGDEIAIAHVQYVTASEDRLILSDAGNERIVVLKLDYHNSEEAPIRLKTIPFKNEK